VAAIRDIVAYTEAYKESVCLLTIDFKEAFDRIFHSYLYTILREYGFSEEFCKRIQRLYANVTSSLNINGKRSQPIPIQSSVRQGCPLSMALFVLCLNPLLNALEKKLTGVKIGGRGTKTTVIAYADDVTIVVSKSEEILIVHDTLRIYERATVAKINIQKSKAFALNSWNTFLKILDIPYYTEMKVFGLHIQNTILASVEKSWNMLTSQIRAQAQDVFQRTLALDQRIRYVKEYLFAIAWYIAQILPPPKDNLRQINMTFLWFLWKGEVFRVPLSTLQRTKKEGVWGMIQPAANCMALIFHRMREQGKKKGMVTADWMKRWGLQAQAENPPYAGRTPNHAGIPISIRYRIGVPRPKRRNDNTQAYKKTSIHDDTLFHESNGWRS
jgi:hypothetical protein